MASKILSNDDKMFGLFCVPDVSLPLAEMYYPLVILFASRADCDPMQQGDLFLFTPSCCHVNEVTGIRIPRQSRMC